MALSSSRTKAIVAHGPLDEGGWKLEEIALRGLKDDELLVNIVAVGVCHTDLLVGSFPSGAAAPYPSILGHEGSGYVTKTGPKVKVAKPGDKVVLSFTSCQSCSFCISNHPAHCLQFVELNMLVGSKGNNAVGKHNDISINGRFFGQSSFSNLSIISEGAVVNVSDLVHGEEQLKLMAPLGCGFQTGAGSLTNLASVRKGDSVAVIGLGGVGMAAIMAAAVKGASPIIAIDCVPAKLELAKTIGATHIVNTAEPNADSVQKVRDLTGGIGASIVIEATGVVPVMSSAINMAAPLGRIILVGLPVGNPKLELPILDLIGTGKRIQGSVEGNVKPSKYIPEMIRWYQNGQFPIDKLIKYYPADKFMDAIADMKSGSVIKPVLVW